MEDAGTLALLLKRLCINEQGDLDLTHFGRAVKIYEAIRIPRVKEILENSHFMGEYVIVFCGYNLAPVVVEYKSFLTCNFVVVYSLMKACN
jgi:hypothetical protein